MQLVPWICTYGGIRGRCTQLLQVGSDSSFRIGGTSQVTKLFWGSAGDDISRELDAEGEMHDLFESPVDF